MARRRTKDGGIERKRRHDEEDEPQGQAQNAGVAAVAGLSVEPAVSARVARAIDTFEARVAIDVPVEDTSATDMPSSGAAQDTAEAEAAPPSQDYRPPSAEFVRAPVVTTSETEETGDSIHVDAARAYLEATVRWEDVDGMSDQELSEALQNEARRALLGIEHDVPLSDEQLDTFAAVKDAELEAEQTQLGRDYLVNTGHFSEDEVASMTPEEVATALEVASRIALQGEWQETDTRVIDDGRTTVTQNGASLSLTNTETGSSTPGESEKGGAGQSGESDTTPEASADGQQDGEDDEDDDDNDDDDGDSTEAETGQTATAEQEDESDDGKGKDTAETTPTPDAAPPVTPAEVQAFLESPVGRESVQQNERAIEMAIGGGLLGPRERQADAEWLESDVSAGERATNGRAVDLAVSGGDTDPVEYEPARGLSAVDELKLVGGGYTDPVDDPQAPPPGDNPVVPGTLVSPQVSAFEEMLEEGLDTARLASLADSIDTSELSDSVDDLES